MKPDIIVVGPRDRKDLYEDRTVINTTSRSRDWSVGLSPFLCGPCYLYGYGKHSRFAHNVENSWQFSKTYKEHDDHGKPNAEWWKWSTQGFLKAQADRYPAGKGRKPEYLWWDNTPLSYLEARIKVYIPLYQEAVRGTEAFYRLRKLARTGEPLALWDFDGRMTNESPKQIVLNPEKKMGHAFVLQWMLVISPFFDMEDL